MPTIKLTTEGVMSLFDDPDRKYITSSLLIDEFDVTRSTAVKKLRSLMTKGLLVRGEVQHKYYPKHIDYLTYEQIVKQLIQHWSDTDHPAINVIPERHGGKMTARGSGMMTPVKYVIQSLLDMELIGK